MKLTVAILLVSFLLPISAFSQFIFEKGYIIDNDGLKKECLILNKDWKNNPTKITYKFSENDKELKTDISKISEFGVYGYSRYVRANVRIDLSLQNEGWLNSEQTMNWYTEQLFLKVLVKGQATLYQYDQPHFQKFFYSVDTSSIKQLIFRNFLVSDFVASNVTFRKQLEKELKCEIKDEIPAFKLDYSKADLEDFFKNYNICKGDSFEIYRTKPSRKLFNIYVTPGLEVNNLSVFFQGKKEAEFNTMQGFRLGLEFESIIPFWNGNLAIFAEPVYHYTSAKKKLKNNQQSVKFQNIEIPFGFRYYTYNTQTTKIFINSSVNTNFGVDFNSDIQVNPNDILNIDSKYSISVGGGIHHKRLGSEIRYTFRTGILSNYTTWTSHFSRLSVIFKYKLY
jgi:hypothetical protein